MQQDILDLAVTNALYFRLCKEIVDDLPTTYELGGEATEWVRRMLPYNVAGGKMNRGLATLSVRNTFAEAAGRRLSNKVSFHALIDVISVGVLFKSA